MMQWGDDRLWGAARAERSLSDLTRELPCDFVVLKNRDLDLSRILVPTEEGYNCDLSAEIAHTLQSAVGSEVSLLHVVESEAEREDGEQFLADWADEHDLADAVRTVDTSGDIERVIEHEARDHTLVMLGATERGLLARLVHDSLSFDVVDDVDCSVLLTERATPRTLSDRLFGRR